MEDMKKKNIDWLFRIFISLSAIWTIRVFWLLYQDQYNPFFYGSMPLNEVGDFLAGSFSPLAFFWLAYGYWIQNKELKNQLLEFKENAKINKRQLVINHHATIERHNVAQPILSIRSKKYKNEKIMNQEKFLDSGFIIVEISNVGADIKLLTIYIEDEKKVYFKEEDRYISTLSFVASIDVFKSDEKNYGAIPIDKKFLEKLKTLENTKEVKLGNIHIKFFDSIGNSKEVIVESCIKKEKNFYEIKHANIKTNLPLPEIDSNGY